MTVRILDRDPRRASMCLNEALAASGLRHPGIIEVVDTGALPDGQLYLATEPLAGESLGERLRRLGSIPVGDAVDFAVQAADALAAAHAEGIVHGALAPDRLLLLPDAGVARGERLKVIDFGVARLGSGGVASSYLAPEQLRGEDADSRADVYALAAITYHALCGAPPTPAGPAPRALNPDIPAPLAAALLRALADAGDERFATMAAFARALADATAPRARRWPLPSRSMAMAITVGAVLFWTERTPERASRFPLARTLANTQHLLGNALASPFRPTPAPMPLRTARGPLIVPLAASPAPPKLPTRRARPPLERR